MTSTQARETSTAPIRLGLKENLAQFSLLVGVNALVGGMIGQERTVLPLLAKEEFHLTAFSSTLTFIAEQTKIELSRRSRAVVRIDEIAYGASADYRDALSSMRGGNEASLKAQGFDAEQIKHLIGLRKTHADLWAGLESGKLSQYDARAALIAYYIKAGKERLNARFFEVKPE